jgi:hypothetical protein
VGTASTTLGISVWAVVVAMKGSMVVGVGPKVVLCMEDDVEALVLEFATEGMSWSKGRNPTIGACSPSIP